MEAGAFQQMLMQKPGVCVYSFDLAVSRGMVNMRYLLSAYVHLKQL